MYGSWDTEWDRQDFLSLWAIFCPFSIALPTSLMILKIKVLKKKMKKMPGDIIILYIHVYRKWISYDIWCRKYKVQQTEIFAILGHFFPFSPLTTWKIKILTLKKHLEISFYKFSPQMIIIWCNGSRDMECDRYNFLSFWTFFCPFTLLRTQKVKILKKWKKPEDIIILQMCTLDDSHMIYGSWDIILDQFLHFCPPNNPKNQSFEKMKKPSGDIITLHMCAINDNHIMYGSWDMKCEWQNFSSFWTLFCPLLSNNPKNQNFKKKWKNPWIYYHFTQQVYHNDNHRMYGSWDMKHDGQDFLLFWTVFCTFTLPLTN